MNATLELAQVKAIDGSLVAAVEVMLNTKHVAELIKKGEIDQIKEAMEQSLSPGSETFEQALFKHYSSGLITKDEALRNSDSATNLSWLLNNAGAKQAGSKPGDMLRPPTRLDQGSGSYSELKLNVDGLDKL